MKKTIEIALKWISPIVVVYILYSQIKSDLPTISNVTSEINFSYLNLTILFILVLLMFLNWFLESFKWKILVSKISKISNSSSIKAILNGLAFGLFTPFRVGDIVTRIGHISSEKRSCTLGSVFLARSSQLTSTLFCGIIGLFFFTQKAYNINSIGLVLILFILIVVYYNIHLLIPYIHKLKILSPYLKYVEILDSYTFNDFTIALTISMIRYFVIVLQYYLMFVFFNVDISLNTVLIGVSVTLMIKSILPIVSVLGDFGIREMVAIYVFKFYGFESFSILSVTISIWLLNVVLPSLVGAFLSKNLKFLS